MRCKIDCSEITDIRWSAAAVNRRQRQRRRHKRVVHRRLTVALARGDPLARERPGATAAPPTGPVIGQRRRRGGGLCARSTRRRCSAEDFTAAPEEGKCCLMVPQQYFLLQRRTIKIHLGYYIRYDMIKILNFFIVLCHCAYSYIDIILDIYI